MKQTTLESVTPELLLKIIDTIHYGCQIIDQNFVYKFVNRTVAIQGKSAKKDLVGKKMMEVYPGIEKTEMFRYLKDCMRQRIPQKFDNEFEYPDGSKRWFELQMEPIDKGVVIFSTDITSRKNTENLLLTRNHELEHAKTVMEVEKLKAEAMLDSLGEAVIVVDTSRRVKLINKIGAAMLGYKQNELIGFDVAKLRLEDEYGKTLPLRDRPTSTALREGKIVINWTMKDRPVNVSPEDTILSKAYYLYRKNGTNFPISGTVTPVKLGETPIGAIITFKDITRELASDKVKSDFVSLASHQLRTPLGISKWYLEALLQNEFIAKAPEKLKGILSNVYDNNERVLSLVRDLLSVSRIDDGSVRNEPIKMDVPAEMKKIMDEMAVVAQKKIKLTLHIQKGLKYFFIDEVKFRETVVNLMTNGIKYNRNGGYVSCTLERDKHNFTITVKDNGFGIPSYDRKSLFTKFYRSRKAIIANPGGSGLGLYVVKNYVDSWKGKIDITSAVGKGTTFVISIPLNLTNNKKS